MIPIFYANIESNECGVSRISLVERPAVEVGFVTFADQQRMRFAVTDEEQRKCFGVAMVAGMPIYRRSDDLGEYYIIFDRQTIRAIMDRFAKEYGNTAVNLDHSTDTQSVVITQSFLSDYQNGITPSGFEFCPDGSWFVEMTVQDDELWQRIKAGEYNGFSVEGLFGMDDADTHKKEQDMTIKEKLAKLLNKQKFAEVKSDKGDLFIDGEIVEGVTVNARNESDEYVPATDGEYVLEDGTTIVVAEGKITEVRKMEELEETAEDVAKMREEIDELYKLVDNILDVVGISRDEADKMSAQMSAMTARVEALEAQPASNSVEKKDVAGKFQSLRQRMGM